MTSHPKDLSDELIAAMRLPKGLPTFTFVYTMWQHRPLKEMNRKYTKENIITD